MAPNVPDKQWAMVIEKTGGPVDYKQIPGMARMVHISSGQQLIDFQSQSPVQTKS